MGKEASKAKFRDGILAKIAKYLETEYDTYVRQVASGEYTMLVPDEEGNKVYVNVKVSVPRGTRNGEGGYNPYDGYKMARDYKDIVEAKAAKKESEKEGE